MKKQVSLEEKKLVGIRLSPQAIEEMKYLTDIYHLSQAGLVETLIRAEYSKFKEDPKMKKMIELLESFREQVNMLKD